MRSKQYSFREFKKILTENGYRVLRTHGDHYIFTNDKQKIVVNKNLNQMVARRLIKENELKIS